MIRLDTPKCRWKQLDTAEKWLRECRNTAFPDYDRKKKLWFIGKGTERIEDTNLDRLLQEFSGVRLQYRYKWNGETVTRSIFAEVLEDMLTRYETLSIAGFEEDYNHWQITWLEKAGERLLELKGKKEG